MLKAKPLRLSFDEEDNNAWSTAIKIPFERAPRHDDRYTGEPYTLEAVLKALRDCVSSAAGWGQGGTARPLGNFNEKLKSIVHGMVDDSNMIVKVVDDVLEAVDCVELTTYYKCLQCGRFI